MPGWAGRELDAARRRADLTLDALHLRYVALGGLASPGALHDHLLGDAPMRATEHDLVAHAINERFLELHVAERVPYGLRDAPN